jgi:hypothetical protein
MVMEYLEGRDLAAVVSSGHLAWSVGQGGVAACTLPNCASTEVAIAKNVPWPHTLAIDGTTVYFTTYASSGAVMKADLGGGALPVVVAADQPNPDRVVVDAKRVYWTNTGNTANPSIGQIMWVAK